jgi:hypothetical protein
MSTDRRIRASRANGALSHGPKTQAGKQRCRLNAVKTGAFAKSIVLKNESPTLLAKLRDEYYQHLQPANPIERDLVEEMVVSKWLCRRAWRLESSSVNYKMDQQKDAVEAQHSSLQEHSRTAIAHTDLYDNSVALPHIQRAQVRNSRAFHRALKQLQDLRRNAQSKNEQTDLVPNPDTANPQNSLPTRRQRVLRRLLQHANPNSEGDSDDIGDSPVGQHHPAILEFK